MAENGSKCDRLGLGLMLACSPRRLPGLSLVPSLLHCYDGTGSRTFLTPAPLNKLHVYGISSESKGSWKGEDLKPRRKKQQHFSFPFLFLGYKQKSS